MTTVPPVMATHYADPLKGNPVCRGNPTSPYAVTYDLKKIDCPTCKLIAPDWWKPSGIAWIDSFWLLVRCLLLEQGKPLATKEEYEQRAVS